MPIRRLKAHLLVPAPGLRADPIALLHDAQRCHKVALHAHTTYQQLQLLLCQDPATEDSQGTRHLQRSVGGWLP